MKKTIKLAFCLILAIAVLSVPAYAAETVGIIGGADGPTAILISPCPEDMETPSITPPEASNGMSVLLNGQYVTFPDVVPQYKNDRTFVPFRAMCSAMGFEDSSIYFDDSTSSACAVRDDITISFPIGEASVTVIKDGVSTVTETDAAAYIDYDRTLVPVRYFAEALGCKVTWDSLTNTIIIDNISAILSENSETYSIMDGLLAYSQPVSDKNMAFSGSITGSFKIEDEFSSLDAAVSGTISGITSRSAMDMDVQANVSGTYIEGTSVLPITALRIPENPYFSMRYDLEGGTIAYKSNMSNTMYGMDVSDVWVLYDLSQMLTSEELYAIKADLDGYTFEELLTYLLESYEPNVSMTVSSLLEWINSVCADSAFTKNGSTYTQTVTLDEYGKLELNVYTSLGKVSGYSIELSYEDNAYSAMYIHAKLTAKGSSVQANISFSVLDESVDMDLTCDVSISFSETTKSPTGKPGENDYVLDVYDYSYY